MEEDEDVVLENGPLFQYLQNTGLESFEQKACEKPSRENSTLTQRRKEFVDKTVLEAVKIIKSTNLLFEEDQELIEVVFSNFQENKNETLRHVLSGKLSAFAVIFGLFLFLYVGYIAFVVVSLFFTYRITECLWEAHRKKLRLTKFITILDNNFKLFCRVVKFVRENEIMLKARFGEAPPTKVQNCLLNLKEDLMIAQQEVNNLFTESTCSLLTKVPLHQCFDSPDDYLCRDMLNNNENLSVSQLHHLLMLLQSQFLTRFAFSVVPMLVVNPNQSKEIVESIMVKIVVRLRDIAGKLMRKYKFLLQNGICLQNDVAPCPLPPRNNRLVPPVDSLVTNIHDLSNSLQYSLILARELESALELCQKQNAERDLVTIQNELVSCQQHIADLLMMQAKFSRAPNVDDDSVMEHVEVTDTEPAKITEIGFSDLNPAVDDDIFEAVISSIDDENKESWAQEEIDPLAKKKQRELMGELKIKLKDKAEDWAVRESIVLARKGLPPPESDNGITESLILKEKGKLKKHVSYGDSSSEEERDPDVERFRSMLAASDFLVPKGNFLSDTMDEFTGSGENSESEAECQ